ncbi:hypothetical protein SNEBB_006931 [Seison nebaliae]|nr:hypothetical protein SNEBB_006931 [Seison nebaliae]
MPSTFLEYPYTECDEISNVTGQKSIFKKAFDLSVSIAESVYAPHVVKKPCKVCRKRINSVAEVAEHGTTQEMIKMIKKKNDVNLFDEFGNTPVINAVMANRPMMVRTLLENGADSNLEGVFKCPPLHAAAQMGHTLCATYLIDHGANIDATDKAGNNALQLALIFDHEDTVDMLLHFKCKILSLNLEYVESKPQMNHILKKLKFASEGDYDRFPLVRTTSLPPMTTLSELKAKMMAEELDNDNEDE